MIKEELFALYPPEKPTEEELDKLKSARAQLRAAEAAKRKRSAAADASLPASRRRTSLAPSSGIDQPESVAQRALGASGVGRAAAFLSQQNRRRSSVHNQEDEDELPPGNGGSLFDMGGAIFDQPPSRLNRLSGGNRSNHPFAPVPAARPTARAPSAAAPKPPKAKQPYVPKLGSANYAFMIVLLQAQRGPEQLEFLQKQELMERAEASGLATAPIMPGAVPRGGFTNQNSRNFYDGWSNFKTLVNHGLVALYSSPRKAKLTVEGFALAERMYRKAVESGKVAPVPGLPVDGPMLFQVQDRPEGAAAVAAAGQAQSAAGLQPEAFPSAALRPSRRAGGGSGSAALQGGGSCGVQSSFFTRETAPAAAPGAGNANASFNPYGSDDPLEIPLAERLNRGANRGVLFGTLSGAVPNARAGHASIPANRSRLDINNNSSRNIATGAAADRGGGGETVYLDLAGSSDDDEDGNSPVLPRNTTINGTATNGTINGTADRRVSDEHVAMMMEMGFSDKKARKVSLTL